MVVRQNNKQDAEGSPFALRPHVMKMSSPANDANGIVDEPSLLSGRKLRNRIILANALVWIGIIVAIRLIFF